MPQHIIKIPFSGQLIGQGYYSDTSESIATALDVDSVFEDSSTDTQSASPAFDLVETQNAKIHAVVSVS